MNHYHKGGGFIHKLTEDCFIVQYYDMVVEICVVCHIISEKSLLSITQVNGTASLTGRYRQKIKGYLI